MYKMEFMFTKFADPEPEMMQIFDIDELPQLVIAFNMNPEKKTADITKDDLRITKISLAIEYEPMYNWFQQVCYILSFNLSQFIFNVQENTKKNVEEENSII